MEIFSQSQLEGPGAISSCELQYRIPKDQKIPVTSVLGPTPMQRDEDAQKTDSRSN